MIDLGPETEVLINNRGHVILGRYGGWSLWENGKRLLFRGPVGRWTRANALNERDQVVGWVEGGEPSGLFGYAVLWTRRRP